MNYTFLPTQLTDSDDDWIESFRRTWYPRLHPHLSSLGDSIGIPLYAVGPVHKNQYVGITKIGEESFERELEKIGFVRNPIACLKSLDDDRLSEGSWVLLSENDPSGKIEDGMQLHITFFEREDGETGREVYAHYEDDWRENATAHLREKNFSAEEGVQIARGILDEHSFMVIE